MDIKYEFPKMITTKSINEISSGTIFTGILDDGTDVELSAYGVKLGAIFHGMIDNGEDLPTDTSIFFRTSRFVVDLQDASKCWFLGDEFTYGSIIIRNYVPLAVKIVIHN